MWIRKHIKKVKYFHKSFENLTDHMEDYKRNKSKTLEVSIISLFYHLLAIIRYFVLILAVGGRCPFWAVAIVASLSVLVSLIPISLNGIGLLDGSFVYLIGFYGVDREESISVMLLNRVLLIIVSVVGGMLYIMENRSMNHTKTT